MEFVDITDVLTAIFGPMNYKDHMIFWMYFDDVNYGDACYTLVTAEYVLDRISTYADDYDLFVTKKDVAAKFWALMGTAQFVNLEA